MRAGPVILVAIAATVGACGLFPSFEDLTACTEDCTTSSTSGGPGGSSAQSSGTGATTSTSTSSGSMSTSTSTSTSTTGVGGGGGASPCALDPSMHGPAGVQVEPPNFATFCIDRTEVSVADYRLFLETSVPLNGDVAFPAQCSWKVDSIDAFTPKGAGGMNTYMWTNYNGGAQDQRPVQGTDWCDAAIFCLWSGKRLCGSDMDHGTIDVANNPNWKHSGEWYRACVGQANLPYGYGPTYDPTTCNTETGAGTDVDPFDTTEVDQPVTCKSVWPDGDLYNMSGNVQEWEDNCEATGATPADDECSPRGGVYKLQQYTSCDYAEGNAPHPLRSSKREYMGFRCCWTPGG